MDQTQSLTQKFLKELNRRNITKNNYNNYYEQVGESPEKIINFSELAYALRKE